jgi:hypothetical protein
LLVADLFLEKKYCCLVADKPNEQGVYLAQIVGTNLSAIT